MTTTAPGSAAQPRPGRGGSVFFVGTATTLIRWGPFTLLTDPNFLHRGQRAYLGRGLTSRRRTEPAMTVEEVPADLDLIVLSHLHGDHWDRLARRHLDHSLPVLTTPTAARRLRRLHRFPRALGMPTWRSHAFGKGDATLRVTALPGRHAPGVAHQLLPPVMGSLLEFGSTSGVIEQRVYVSGDTLMFDGVHDIARRYPHIDVSLLHLGGTRLPGGLLVTMDAVQGADMLETIRPRTAVPIHYDDYTVFRSSLADFRAEVVRRGLTHSVSYLERGETLRFGD
jgi:L-ascorbate metabolism protein UlaG (beta-lactamase superfamily)